MYTHPSIGFKCSEVFVFTFVGKLFGIDWHDYAFSFSQSQKDYFFPITEYSRNETLNVSHFGHNLFLLTYVTLHSGRQLKKGNTYTAIYIVYYLRYKKFFWKLMYMVWRSTIFWLLSKQFNLSYKFWQNVHRLLSLSLLKMDKIPLTESNVFFFLLQIKIFTNFGKSLRQISFLRCVIFFSNNFIRKLTIKVKFENVVTSCSGYNKVNVSIVYKEKGLPKYKSTILLSLL